MKTMEIVEIPRNKEGKEHIVFGKKTITLQQLS